MADVNLKGSFFSSPNLSLRFQTGTGGSILLTSQTTLKLDDDINPVKVYALGSYGAIGATDGIYNASGEISGPTQFITYLMDQLAAADPSGSNSPGKTVFNLAGIVSNGVDPSYKLEAKQCRALKLNDDFAAGDPKQLVQTVPLLIIDGIYRNGRRLLNPQPTLGVR